MICSSQTVRLANQCFTTRTSRTGRAKRYMPLYGSYQFVCIGQSSNVMKGVAHCGYVMMAVLIACLIIVSQSDRASRLFDLYTSGLHQAIVLTANVSLGDYGCISILTWAVVD